MVLADGLPIERAPLKKAPVETGPIVLTERAARRVSEILRAEPSGTALHISVEGGGCSGFQYRYDLKADAPDADAVVLPAGEGRVVVDAVSAGLMSGARIDFVDDLMGQAFRIDNPLAVASCGCGTSFTI